MKDDIITLAKLLHACLEEIAENDDKTKENLLVLKNILYGFIEKMEI